MTGEEPEAEAEASAEGPSSSSTTSREDLVRAASDSATSSRVLDGLPPVGTARPALPQIPEGDAPFTPVRVSRRTAPESPCFTGQDEFVETEAIPPRPEIDPAKLSRDSWELRPAEGVLRRHHVKWRSHVFTPLEATKAPVPFNLLTCERRTVARFKDSDLKEWSDDWRQLRPSFSLKAKWKGFTDFYLTKKALKEVKMPLFEEDTVEGPYTFLTLSPDIFAAKKTSSDEVAERDIPAEDWPDWLIEDASEWGKIVASGAVKVLSATPTGS